MIDIHSHALYDCDDGSKSINQTIEMIKSAQKSGVTAIFFTPHYIEDGYKNDIDSILEKTNLIKKKLKENKIDVELYNGEEIFIYPSLDEEIDKKIISLNNSKYVLIELPMLEEVYYTEDVIYKLLSNGKVPIIAHPERYLKSEKDFSFIQNLVDRGALMQININSLVGYYGKTAKNIAKKMLKQNIVHFVASDAHSTYGYNNVSESLKLLMKIVGKEKFNEITYENQKKIIFNQEIVSEKVSKEPRRKIFSLAFLRGGITKC